MGEVTKNLGRFYLLAGFLPAAVFFVLVRLVILPYLPQVWQTAFDQAVSSALGGDLAGYLLAPLILGALLASLSPQVIWLFRVGFAVIRPFTKARTEYDDYSRERAHLADQLAETKHVLDAELAGGNDPANIQALRKKLSQLESKLIVLYQGMRKVSGGALLLEAERLKASRLGNAFAWIEEYPERRYGMAFGAFWPRLEAALPKEFGERVEARYTTLALLLNLSFISLIFAFLWLGLGLAGLLGWPMPLPQVWAAVWLLFLAVAYLFYRTAVIQALQLAEIIHSAFDLYRGDLLKRYQVAIPGRLEEEIKVWQQIGQFITLGEARFHPPLDQTKENKK